MLQGPIGPKGDIGQQGIKGEDVAIGPKDDKGDIGITETVAPDIEIIVTNVGTNKDVILNFKIPRGTSGEKGDQGSIGPQGPAGTTQTVAYAERYLDATQELKLTASTDTIVPLNNSGPAFFANYDTENSIDIKQAGFYLISYFFSDEPKEDCTLTFAVKYNDLLIPASNVTVKWQANSINSVSNSIIAALQE